MSKAPLDDTIITVISRMVDDSQGPTRQPSHSDLESYISRCGLAEGDPNTQGQVVGKAKRVRGTLNWAVEYSPRNGQAFVALLMACLKGSGSFRPTSPNYIGEQVIRDAIGAFAASGFTLTSDGTLQPTLLDSLAGREVTEALRVYAQRAQRAATVDMALITGTGKDLLEATAAHVLVEKNGEYPNTNFPALLGLAFVAVDLKTPQHKTMSGEPYNHRLERALFDAACAVNTLRNKQGTGHGRPWLPTVTPQEAIRAVQVMGIIAELLLDKLEIET